MSQSIRAHLKAQSRNGSSDQNARWNEKVRSGQRSAALSGLRLEQRTDAATTKNRRSLHQPSNGFAKPVVAMKFSGLYMWPPVAARPSSQLLEAEPRHCEEPTTSHQDAGPHI